MHTNERQIGRQLQRRGLLVAVLGCAAGSSRALAQSRGLAQVATPSVLQRGEMSQGIAVEIMRLARVPGGNAVELRFDLVNTSSQPVSILQLGLLQFVAARPPQPAMHVLRGVRLLDAQNGVIYDIGTGGERPLATTTGGSSSSPDQVVPPGGRKPLWAMFGAPPPHVNQLTVLIESLAPMAGVPLSA